MKNIIIYLSMLTPVLLSGCLGEKLISISNDFHKQANNMICIKHSSNVESGAMISMSNDIDNIALNREGPRKSCATFSYENNKIVVTSVNNDNVEIKPYKKYSFHTDIIRKNGSADKASGHGPDLCFTKDTKGNFILEIVNFGDNSLFLNSLGCQ